jgi:hypothetical protein
MHKTEDKILNKSKYELQMKRQRCQDIYYILLGFFLMIFNAFIYLYIYIFIFIYLYLFIFIFYLKNLGYNWKPTIIKKGFHIITE